jgi:cyclophilin family peptidyl-prolyl cis-trans isomerase
VIDGTRLRRSALAGLAGMVLAVVGAGSGAAQGEVEPFAPEGCWSSEASTDEGYPQWDDAPEMVIDEDATYQALITTNKGEMTFELNTEAAPETVNNFICLATSDFYDITPFHRVISGFMVQAGDPTGTGGGGPGYRFGDELPGDDLEYTKGTLAMANAGPDTQGSQFFIVHDDLGGQLPKDYTIFGQLIEGEDVLDDIADSAVVPSQRGEPSVPVEFLVIKDITITVAPES